MTKRTTKSVRKILTRKLV